MPLPREDETLIGIGEYLMAQLNSYVDDTEFMVVRGLSVNARDQYKNFPLLGVYRRDSSGSQLEQCDIEIIYYASALNESIYFRWLELRMIEILNNYFFQKANCLEILSPFRSRQGVVRTHDNLMLAQLKLTGTIRDNHRLE